MKYTILLWLFFKVKILSEILKRLKKKAGSSLQTTLLKYELRAERLLKFNAFLSQHI